MLIEDLDLPYDYIDNPRAGSVTGVVIALVASIGLGLMAYFDPIELFTIPWWVAIIPIGLVAIRGFLFSIILNATHEALRGAEQDKRLDKIIYDRAIAEQNAQPLLNAQTFAKRLIEDRAEQD